MKKILLLIPVLFLSAEGKAPDKDDPKFVSLKEAHDGGIQADLKILNQFQDQPHETQMFYLEGREAILGENADKILAQVCEKFGKKIIGAPHLGQLKTDSVTVRVQTPERSKLQVIVKSKDGEQTFKSNSAERISFINCDGLSPDTAYTYEVKNEEAETLGVGEFHTAPEKGTPFKMAVGADFHKIGLHRPELLDLVAERGNRAMMLLGDLAVDGRRDVPTRKIDYLLRDVSPVWQRFSARVPSYTSWDDHDYYGDDTGGAYHQKPERPIPRDAMRAHWKEIWNNPEREVDREGIYFQSVIGDVQLIMLDTRSCRVNEERGKLNSFLGETQMDWLKKTLKESTSSIILLSGGTMWTDYISAGKDSWGTWDTEGREEVLQALDALTDKKVLLFSGDRHGAHAFKIQRPNGREYVEFGVGTLGGVPGGGEASDDSQQLFAYRGTGFWAFGELEFTYPEGEPAVSFMLIDPEGKVLEKVEL